MRADRKTGRAVCAVSLLTAVTVLGCDLTEVELTSSEDTVIVEALFQNRSNPTMLVFLHRSVQGAAGANSPVPGAVVRLTLASGDEVVVPQVARGLCVASTPISGTGSCYSVTGPLVRPIAPGDLLRLHIRTAEGEVITAATRLPGTFQILTTSPGGRCTVNAEDPLEILWTRAEGAWAYVNEVEIGGLPEGNLTLLGLSISATDTTIVMPGEFGIFDRADLSRELLEKLQKGMPAESFANVTVTAVDRNYVNWVRASNFNPSGPVRVSSVRGDGVGYFGSGVVRDLAVTTFLSVPREPICQEFAGG